MKSFKKRRTCDVCKQNINNPGAFCKECKIAVHKTCDAKVGQKLYIQPKFTQSTQLTLFYSEKGLLLGGNV
ncbi:hypothetical protein ILYODFUR_034062 [Ilyodon furcidens]|uniref:Phorbol-ester/DAG-type domain-containing protein n=1 Tax=Ilyodon furcidens TaxID=33524 RepID=A0ABV0T3M2_9TELE